MSFRLFFKNQAGLTLLETTVALGILMLGILASLTLMMSSFNFTHRSEKEIIVVNLAREGLELVRSSRNQKTCDGTATTCTSDSVCSSNVTCLSKIFQGQYSEDANGERYLIDSSATGDNSTANFLEATNNLSTYSNVSECADCALNIYNNQYVHSALGEPTEIKRMITIKPSSNNPDKKIITSAVSWTEKNKTYTYTLETVLYNWQ